MREEQFRNVALLVQHARYQRLRNPDQIAICHRGSRCDAQLLTCQASLAEEVTVAQDGDDRFLALVGCHRELHLALSDVEHGIRRLSLAEDIAVRAVFNVGFPAGESSEEGFPIDRLVFLICRNNLRLASVTRHNNLPVPRQYHICLRIIDFSTSDLRYSPSCLDFALRFCVCFFRHRMSGRWPLRTLPSVSSWR